MAKSFSEQISMFAEQTEKTIDEVVVDYVIGITARITEATPVGEPSEWKSKAPPGYVGGTARANWIPSIGSAETSPIESTDKERPKTLVRALGQRISGNLFYLTNNVPYIERLEYGWSDQAPKGMMRTTLRSARKLLNDSVNKNTRR